MKQQVIRLLRKQASIFFVFTLSLLLLLTSRALAQTEKITAPVSLEAATIPLPDLLQALQKQSNYTFTFDKTKLAGIAIHDIRWNKTPLGKALAELKQKAGLDYVLLDNNIAVTLKPSREESAPAKKNNGALTGSILDEENGEPVAGATIRAGGKATVSGPDGAFFLSLPEGKYVAEISFVGYGGQKITDIIVKDQQPFQVTVSLKRQQGTLQGVVVTHTASRASVASLYVRQKNAAGITDGISAEQIGRTPDKNIAETLRRISGVTNLDNKYVVVRGLSERYNQSMINGQLMPSTELNRKNFSFDLIPANLVDNVIVSKTLTPDLPAEFGGGLVQVNTKDIPSSNSFSVTVGGSINDKTTGKDFRFPNIVSKNYLGGIDDNRKLFGTLNWKSRKDIINSGNFGEASSTGERPLKDPKLFNNNWALYHYKPLPSLNGQLSLTRVIPLKGERQLGVIASASYRNTWQTQDVRMTRDGYAEKLTSGEVEPGFTGKRYGFVANVGGLAGIGYRSKNLKVSFQSLYLRTLDQQFIIGLGDNDPVGTAVGYNDLVTATSLWQNQLKSEHAIGKKGIRLNLSLSYTLLDRQKPDNHQANFPYKGMKGDHPDSLGTDFTVGNGVSSGASGQALRWWSRALEKNLAWNADLSIPFAFKALRIPVTSVLKTGYAGWKKDRSFWVFLSGSVNTTSQYSPLSERYDPSVVSISFPKFGDDFHRKPELHAGYIMLDNKIGKKLRLVWGLRAEYYNLNGVNAILEDFVEKQRAGNQDKQDYSALFNREPNMNYFPSANITYSLTPKMNLRLAYSKSIIRPDLRELAFFQEYDFELGGSYSSQAPLISTKIHHFDFRYEYYPSAGEVLSFSLFYKKLLYPMEIFAKDNRLFDLRNDKEAINKGFEIEARKSLAFTKVPVIKQITLYGNLTRMFPTVKLLGIDYNTVDPEHPNKLVIKEWVGEAEKRPQSGASNFIYNAGLQYDNKYFSLSGSYSYLTNRFYRVGEGDNPSLYEQPMQLLDAQLAIKLLRDKGLVKLSAGNLLNSKYIVYGNLYEGRLVNPPDGRKPTTKDLLYQKGKDRVDYEAAPGRTWSVSFNYNF